MRRLVNTQPMIMNPIPASFSAMSTIRTPGFGEQVLDRAGDARERSYRHPFATEGVTGLRGGARGLRVHPCEGAPPLLEGSATRARASSTGLRLVARRSASDAINDARLRIAPSLPVFVVGVDLE